MRVEEAKLRCARAMGLQSPIYKHDGGRWKEAADQDAQITTSCVR